MGAATAMGSVEVAGAGEAAAGAGAGVLSMPDMSKKRDSMGILDLGEVVGSSKVGVGRLSAVGALL